MPQNQLKVNKSLAQNFWKCQQVQWVLEAKRRRRMALGQALNAFIINRTDWEQTHNDPLEIIAKELNQLTEQEHAETRFQIALFNQIHWTALDVTVCSGQIKVLVVDAADDGRGDEAAEFLAQNLTNAQVYYLQPDLFTSSVNHSRVLRTIQSDNNSCSLMTLGHIFMLSSLPVSQLLSDVPFEIENKIRKISPLNLPGQLRKLYALTQDPIIFKSMGQQKSDKHINKKGESLQEFFARHQSIARGSVVYNKKETYSQKVLSMFKDEDVESMNFKHLSLAALCDFLNTSTKQGLEAFHSQLVEQPIQTIMCAILNKRIEELKFKPQSNGFSFFSSRARTLRHMHELLHIISNEREPKQLPGTIHKYLNRLDQQTVEMLTAVLHHLDKSLLDKQSSLNVYNGVEWYFSDRL